MPFPHVPEAAAAPTARRIQPRAGRALASAALGQTSTHHPPAQGRALNGRGRACAAERHHARADDLAASPALLQSATLREAASCKPQGLRPGLTPAGRWPTARADSKPVAAQLGYSTSQPSRSSRSSAHPASLKQAPGCHSRGSSFSESTGAACLCRGGGSGGRGSPGARGRRACW